MQEESNLIYFFVAVIALILTVLFDFAMFKWEEHKEVNESWKALNEQLEREGKERWDKRKK